MNKIVIIYSFSVQMFWVSTILFRFWKRFLALTKAALFDHTFSKDSAIVKYYYNLK